MPQLVCDIDVLDTVEHELNRLCQRHSFDITRKPIGVQCIVSQYENSIVALANGVSGRLGRVLTCRVAWLVVSPDRPSDGQLHELAVVPQESKWR